MSIRNLCHTRETGRARASFAAGSSIPIRLAGEAVLPATAFAKDINDVAQALGALQPVHLERDLDCLCVCRFHGANDGRVLLHGGVQGIDDRAGIEPPVTLSLRFNAAVQRGKPRTGSVLDDEPMEFTVNLEDLPRVAALAGGNARKAFVQRAQLSADLLALCLGKQSNAAAGNSFQVADDQ